MSSIKMLSFLQLCMPVCDFLLVKPRTCESIIFHLYHQITNTLLLYLLKWHAHCSSIFNKQLSLYTWFITYLNDLLSGLNLAGWTDTYISFAPLTIIHYANKLLNLFCMIILCTVSGNRRTGPLNQNWIPSCMKLMNNSKN